MKFHYGVISIMKLYIFSKIIKYIKFEETKKQLVEKKAINRLWCNLLKLYHKQNFDFTKMFSKITVLRISYTGIY